MIGSALIFPVEIVESLEVVAQQDADKVELKRRDRFLPRLGDPPLFRQETRL